MKNFLIACAAMVIVVSLIAQVPDPNKPKVTPPKMVEVSPKQPYSDMEMKLALERQAFDESQINNLSLQAQLQIEQKGAPYRSDSAAAEKDLQAWIAAVKKANGWGDDVAFNRQARKFERPEPVAEKVVVPDTVPTPGGAPPKLPQGPSKN